MTQLTTADPSFSDCDVRAQAYPSHRVTSVIRGVHRLLFRCSVIVVTVGPVGCVSSTPQFDAIYFPSPAAPAHAVFLASFDRLADIAPRSRSFVDMVRGGAVSPYIGRPAGIAYRNGLFYVCDGGLNVVHVWDLKTGLAQRFGETGDVILAEPVAVAVDEHGRVYVADASRGEVIEFDASGQVLNRYRVDGDKHYRPVAVAVRSGLLYVADIARHSVDVFALDEGRATGEGARRSVPGEFHFPMGLALDDAGSLYVADAMNARVHVFDTTLTPVRTFGQPGNRYGDLGKPRHLAIGPDGVVFIADPEFAHVHLFNARGQLLMMLGGREDRPGGTPLPLGVAIARSLPQRLTGMVPSDFRADYFLFVSDGIASKSISLYAIGVGR